MLKIFSGLGGNKKDEVLTKSLLEEETRKFKDLFSQFAERLDRLGINMTDVLGEIDGISETLARQVADVQNSHKATEEISETNKHLSDPVEGLLPVIEGALNDMNQSAEMVTGTADAIAKTTEGAVATANELDKASSSLEDLSGIGNTIKDIADQTNLLALNAAIEAARAGESGRGFAVVADEVRKLSEKTKQQVEEINSVLSKVITNVKQATAESHKSESQVRQISDITQKIGTSMSNSKAAIEQVLSVTQETATMAKENTEHCSTVMTGLGAVSVGLGTTNDQLNKAEKSIQSSVRALEDLMRLIADSGVDTRDKIFIDKGIEVAGAISASLEAAVREGRMRADDLFSDKYTPISGTNPQQHATPSIGLLEQIMPQILNPVLSMDPRVNYCVAVDKNGYVAVHNPNHSKPQRTPSNENDIKWNTVNSRNRRFFKDRVNMAAAQNRERFLLQTYRRNLDGNILLYKEVDAPLQVNGRHWGTIRLGYRVD